MSKKKNKKIRINISETRVKDMMNSQDYIMKNGKESYVELFSEMIEHIAESSNVIKEYVDNILPDSLYCEVTNLDDSDIEEFKNGSDKYKDLEMFCTSIDISALDGTMIGCVYFGLDKNSKRSDGFIISTILNIDRSCEDDYSSEVADLTECYGDENDGIISLLSNNDFISYLVANNVCRKNYGEYLYLESLCDVGLPVNFEITYDNVDEVSKKAKDRMELFSKRVMETTPYTVSSVKCDNEKLYVHFNDTESGEVKFIYAIDLHSGESTININKTEKKMSKNMIEKVIKRFRKYRDIEFLISHIYQIFSVMSYCNSMKKASDTLAN